MISHNAVVACRQQHMLPSDASKTARGHSGAKPNPPGSAQEPSRGHPRDEPFTGTRMLFALTSMAKRMSPVLSSCVTHQQPPHAGLQDPTPAGMPAIMQAALPSNDCTTCSGSCAASSVMGHGKMTCSCLAAHLSCMCVGQVRFVASRRPHQCSRTLLAIAAP